MLIHLQAYLEVRTEVGTYQPSSSVIRGLKRSTASRVRFTSSAVRFHHVSPPYSVDRVTSLWCAFLFVLKVGHWDWVFFLGGNWIHQLARSEEDEFSVGVAPVSGLPWQASRRWELPMSYDHLEPQFTFKFLSHPNRFLLLWYSSLTIHHMALVWFFFRSTPPGGIVENWARRCRRRQWEGWSYRRRCRHMVITEFSFGVWNKGSSERCFRVRVWFPVVSLSGALGTLASHLVQLFWAPVGFPSCISPKHENNRLSYVERYRYGAISSSAWSCTYVYDHLG